MLSRKADINLERRNERTARNNITQLAFKKASKALVKSTLVEIYQKHKIVTTIFNNSFMVLLNLDSIWTAGVGSIK